MEEYGRAERTTVDSMARTHCMLDNLRLQTESQNM